MKTTTTLCDTLPVEDVEIGTPLIRIFESAQPVTITDDSGMTSEKYLCEIIMMDSAEYQSLLNGTWMGPWSEVTHRLFREHQHNRTTSLMAMAVRKAKTDERYNDYIAALDAWNASVSALADGFSTIVPDLPEMP